MSKNLKQLNKESVITILLYLFYFAWWYYFAYIYISGPDDFTFGLPSWFFYSCVLGLVVINILVFIAVKFFFKEIDLD